MSKFSLIRFLAAAIITLTATACSSGVERSAPPTQTQPGTQATAQQQPPAQLGSIQPTPTSDQRETQAPDPSVQEILQDMDVATEVVNNYWASHWSEFFTGSYSPPRVVGLYDGTGADVPLCDGKPLEAGNAHYCESGDFVAWDASLMESGFRSGDAWVYLVIAHEWGHAIQARLSKTLESQQAELQADCFAGAVLYGARDDGTLQFEPGDEREIANGLAIVADETPWTKEGDHGDTFERIQAFGTGRSGGVGACLPIS